MPMETKNNTSNAVSVRERPAAVGHTTRTYVFAADASANVAGVGIGSSHGSSMQVGLTQGGTLVRRHVVRVRAVAPQNPPTS